MQIKTTLICSPNNMHYIPLPTQEAELILENIGKRVLCIVNGIGKIQCAILRSNAIGYYITVGKATKKKIFAEAGDTLILDIQRDESEYQAEVPEELAVVLETDEEAMLFFKQLTPGKKRSIIHYISTAKQSDTRISRALKIVDYIKMGITDLRKMK